MMKPMRWTNRALQNRVEREVERDAVDRTLVAPESVVPDLPGRRTLICRYFDQTLQPQRRASQVVEKTNEMQFAVAA